ncbi:MAG: rhodanese-like domain-containing protein [Peptoniphilus sp.]|nr:rhodanese-like domain-containing protein [Peptoniphilus sp.]MDY3118809.1 rhodanese-like domain-containing protein [Peptoniphilus sp.]
MKLAKLFVVTALSVTLLAGCAGGAKNNAAANNGEAKEAPKVEMKDLPGTARDGSEVAIEKASMALVKAAEEGKYQMINAEDLKKKIDAKDDMLIVDTMPEKSFKKNRIPGAVNAELPVKMEEVKPEQKEAFIKALGTDKNKTIVLYCGFVGCERSHVGALIAKEAGFTNIIRQPGGIGAWLEAGYPVESDK